MKYAHVVEAGAKVKLSKITTKPPKGLDRAHAEAKHAKFLEEISELQEELYAAGLNSAVIILQGMDTSGKDGTIRNVFGALSPQGCQVESFKVPNSEELAHDFLWRAHRATPRKGMIAVFNRSYYEDVLVVRVHKLVGKKVWSKRYEQINDFEQMLTANETLVLKFFLHISKDEQEQRLRDREQDIEKAWKLSAGDWQERTFWDDYMAAYEDALATCTTEHAPWYVIPADDKWFRNLAVAEVIVDRLKDYRATWKKTLEAMSAARLAELAAYRQENAPVVPASE